VEYLSNVKYSEHAATPPTGIPLPMVLSAIPDDDHTTLLDDISRYRCRARMGMILDQRNRRVVGFHQSEGFFSNFL